MHYDIHYNKSRPLKARMEKALEDSADYLGSERLATVIDALHEDMMVQKLNPKHLRCLKRCLCLAGIQGFPVRAIIRMAYYGKIKDYLKGKSS